MSEKSTNVKKRIAAYLIDHLLVWLLIVSMYPFFYLILFFIPETHNEALIDILTLIFTFIIFITIPILYFTIFEVWKATTPGKKLYCLEIFDKSTEEEKKITFKQAFVRSLSKVRIELVFLDMIVGFITKYGENRRLLEQISDTYVMDVPPPQLNQSARRTMRVYKRVLTICGIIFLAFIVLVYSFGYFDFLSSFNQR